MPLLANIALSALDDHFIERWQSESGSRVDRARRKRHGRANYRLVRYADDFVVLVAGTEAHAEAVKDEVAAVLAPMGLRLSAAKTRVVHIDGGFDFLGFRIQRHRRRGTGRRYVYSYPSKAALGAVKRKVKSISRQGTNKPLADLLRQSTWCCGDGPPTSATACPPRPSATYATRAGAGSSTGCGTNTGALS